MLNNERQKVDQNNLNSNSALEGSFYINVPGDKQRAQQRARRLAREIID
jgi:hypothetical protein